MSRLLDAAGDARFIFVVGKGGVGKTTTAGALAVDSADSGAATHVISTDPAHSLLDLFAGDRCSELLRIEELDAAARAHAWVERTLGPVSSLVERGTYLDAADVLDFSRLALPGVDEMMAVLRLGELSADGADRVIVDTAPTGHTLRLLDAGVTFETLAGALDAMAMKARAVAAALVGATAAPGEEVIAELRENVRRYRDDVLAAAAFIVVARAGTVIEAETERLLDGLADRRLHVAALLWVGAVGHLERAPASLRVPRTPGTAGCAALRAWSVAVAEAERTTADTPDVASAAAQPAAESFARWLRSEAPPLLLFAGKGGVGKSTCAAAAAVLLAEDEDVLLCSADPAGSIADVLAGEGARRLRTLQIDPARELGRLRDEYREDVIAALDRIGLSDAAALDRRVIEALWDLTPPGLDEVAATVAMLDAAERNERVILDAAPTGHFLRMLETPDTALAWVRQLMRVIVKYGIAGVAANAAESLVQLSRQLKSLVQRLRDPARTAVVIVTLDEPLVGAETRRLTAALASAHIPVAATIVNRSRGPDTAPGGVSARHIRAPESADLQGAAALREFVATWKIVT